MLGLLIKEAANAPKMLEQYYGKFLVEPIKAFSLPYNPANKAPASLIKENLPYILQAVKDAGIKSIIVADATYFKKIIKDTKAEPHYGYVMGCQIEGFEDLEVFVTVNYQALFHNPKLQDNLDLSIKSINAHLQGTHQDPGTGIIHSSAYPLTVPDIENALHSLLTYPTLAVDTETFGLDVAKAGLGTIGFAWDQHNGIAFPVGYFGNGREDEKLEAFQIRDLLKEFFTQYKGTLRFHNASFDIRVLIYYCFMKHPLDRKGLVDALDILFRDTHDTAILVYLTTNSTTGNILALKPNAFRFAGNYAKEDIADITKIPLMEILEYNLVDCLSTNYVYEDRYPILVKEQQEAVYQELFRPSLKNITDMELSGAPMDWNKIQLLAWNLHKIDASNANRVRAFNAVQDYVWTLRKEAFTKANAKLKKKIKPIDDFQVEFNPNSNHHLRGLLYQHFDLPVLGTTDTGQPSTDQKTLVKLLNHLKETYDLSDEDINGSGASP